VRREKKCLDCGSRFRSVKNIRCKKCKYNLIASKINQYIIDNSDKTLNLKELWSFAEARKVYGKKICTKLVKDFADKLNVVLYYKRNVNEVHGLAKYSKGCKCNICKICNYLRGKFNDLLIKIKDNEITEIVNNHIKEYKSKHQFCRIIITLVQNNFPKKEIKHGISGYRAKCRCDICKLAIRIQRYKWKKQGGTMIKSKLIEKIISEYSEELLNCDQKDFSNILDEIILRFSNQNK